MNIHDVQSVSGRHGRSTRDAVPQAHGVTEYARGEMGLLYGTLELNKQPESPCLLVLSWRIWKGDWGLATTETRL